MIEKLPFVLVNQAGEQIVGDLRHNGEGEKNPVVVVMHSFMAFKDWGWFPFVAESMAAEGFAVVTFNFSRNGVRDNPRRITEFTEFERNTISRELHDAQIVLDAIRNNQIDEIAGASNVVLMGHSRGGGEAILISAGRQDVGGLITWSSVATFDRWTEHQKAEWRKLGHLPLARDGSTSPLRLGLDLLADVEKNKEKLDIIRAASKFRRPWLLVHGTEDLKVKISEGQQLYAVADKTNTEFIPLKQVGHTYGGAEVTENSAIHRVMGLTVSWLKNHFSSN